MIRRILCHPRGLHWEQCGVTRTQIHKNFLVNSCTALQSNQIAAGRPLSEMLQGRQEISSVQQGLEDMISRVLFLSKSHSVRNGF